MFSLGFSQETPDLFEYEQSTLQGFYFFDAVLINNTQIDSDDWVGAFKGDVCVGARQWDTSLCGGGLCDVPVMGYDGSEYTDGYMLLGQIPTFKIYDASENIYIVKFIIFFNIYLIIFRLRYLVLQYRKVYII